jgi:hypothetical protein
MAISSAKAQDTIVKITGEKVPAKVTEVGINDITYKRTGMEDGPSFIELKSNIAYVRFRDGQKQVYATPTASKEQLINQTTQQKTALDGAYTKVTLDTASLKKPLTQQSNPYANNASVHNHIDLMNRRYTINGQKAGSRDVDRLLSKSKNPAVQLGFRTAKTTKTIQKIIGITSIPGTVAGGITSISTFATCFSEARHGSIQTGSYINAGISFLSTLTLPITSKILKNRRDKLYDKVIDIYNETN